VRNVDGGIELNPESGRPLHAGDQLIVISEDDDTIFRATVAPIASDVISVAEDPVPTPLRTLILSWNRRALDVLRELDQYVASGSEVYVVAGHANAEAQVVDMSGKLSNVVVEYKAEDSSDRGVLESLHIEDFDHVIALCADDVDAKLADSRTRGVYAMLPTKAKRPLVSTAANVSPLCPS